MAMSRKQCAISLVAVVIIFAVVFCLSLLVRYFPAGRRLGLSRASSVAEADVQDRWKPEVKSHPRVNKPSYRVNDSVVAEIVSFIICLSLTPVYFDRFGPLET